MTDGRVEVITSVQRRRRWSEAEKERLVAATLVPGANASALAREDRLHVSQLFRCRRQLCKRTQPRFAAVTLAPATSSPSVIEVELATGARLRSAAAGA
jgi:transposase